MVRTRFAPSPTGHLHIGGLRTAIYAYALAKHNNGEFILRIEDTDAKREVSGSKEEIKKILEVCKLKWDEIYIQSERVKTGIYEKAARKLVEEGHAFYCDCKSKNAKTEGYSEKLRDPCRDKGLSSGAIKLRVPEDKIAKFKDFVLKKEVLWNTSDIPDATLLKSDGYPTYHLAVVVDDHDMKISHVLRGHDWMPSTPIHLLVYKYLGFNRPEIGHLTDILDPEGGKLSKRKGSVSVVELIGEGYLPEAIANYVMLLGWAPKDDRELFTIEKFVELFSEDGFQKANPTFNQAKLDWFNGEYIRLTPISHLKFLISIFFEEKYENSLVERVLPLVQSRIKTLKEFEDLAEFFFKRPKLSKDQKNGLNQKHLKSAVEAVEKVGNWDLDTLNKAMLDSIDKSGFKTGDFFMTLRIAITGSRFTPPINESMVILGKDEVVRRIRSALK